MQKTFLGAVLLSTAVLYLTGCAPSPVGAEMAKIGMIESRNPLTNIPRPLTYVAFSHGVPTEFFCYPSDDQLKQYVRDGGTSPEVNQITSKSSQGKVVVDPEIVKKINAELAASGEKTQVEKIKLHLSNATVNVVDPSRIYTEILPKKACSQYVKAHQDAGHVVSIVDSNYTADAEYEVVTESTSSGNLSASAQQIIKAELHAQSASSGDRLESGKNTIWGYAVPKIPLPM